MEFSEGTGKAVMGFIAVFHSDIDHLSVRTRQFLCGSAKPSAAYILSYRKTAKSAEYPLKMK